MNRSKDLADRVMLQIKEQDIHMRPRGYFIFLNWITKLLVIIAVTTSIYFTGLIIFKFKLYQPFGYLWFGFLGLRAFIESIPWLIIMYGVLSAGLAYFLLRRFQFAYRQSIPAFIASFMIVLIGSGFLLDSSGINWQIRQANKVPQLYHGIFYSDILVMGEVSKVEQNKLTIKTINDEIVTVYWTGKTKLPSGSKFQTGQTIQAVGVMKNDNFSAKGIIKVTNSYK